MVGRPVADRDRADRGDTPPARRTPPGRRRSAAGGMPKKQAPSPSSTAVSSISRLAKPVSMCQYGTGQRSRRPVRPALVRLGVPVQVGRLVGVRHDDQRRPAHARQPELPPAAVRAWSPPRTAPGPPAPPAPGSPSPGRSRPTARAPRGRAAGPPRRAAPGGPGRSCAPSAAGGRPRRTPRLRPPGPDAPGAAPGRRPGSSVTRSRPERNASGGQVIGSIATDRRCRSPVQRVPGEHLPPAELRVRPDASPPPAVRRGEGHRRAAVGVADHVAERGVEHGVADPARAR